MAAAVTVVEAAILLVHLVAVTAGGDVSLIHGLKMVIQTVIMSIPIKKMLIVDVILQVILV